MITDFWNAGSIIKDSLSPIEDGLRSIFTDMFNSFLFLLQSQQQQERSTMDYLPLIAGAGIGILIIFKKKLLRFAYIRTYLVTDLHKTIPLHYSVTLFRYTIPLHYSVTLFRYTTFTLTRLSCLSINHFNVSRTC